MDENDNKAEFTVPEHQKVARGRKLYSAIAKDAQIGTPVTQVQVSIKLSRSDTDFRSMMTNFVVNFDFLTTFRPKMLTVDTLAKFVMNLTLKIHCRRPTLKLIQNLE